MEGDGPVKRGQGQVRCQLDRRERRGGKDHMRVQITENRNLKLGGNQHLITAPISLNIEEYLLENTNERYSYSLSSKEDGKEGVLVGLSLWRVRGVWEKIFFPTSSLRKNGWHIDLTERGKTEGTRQENRETRLHQASGKRKRGEAVVPRINC